VPDTCPTARDEGESALSSLFSDRQIRPLRAVESHRIFRVALLTALLLSSRGAQAQGLAAGSRAAPSSGAANAPSCLASIPDSALVPAVLYLHASDLRRLDAAAQRNAREIDLFALSVAERFRALLRAKPDVLPAGEPAITWRTRENALTVVVDRDGRFVTRIPVGADGYPDLLGTEQRSRLLAAAVDSLRADGERFPFTSGPADSVVFDLLLSLGRFDADDKLSPPKVRAGFPVATLRVPREEKVRVRRMPHLQYPARERRQEIEANIKMQFVVDTTGRVDPATIHDVYPEGGPPLSEGEKWAYDAFVLAARRAILAAAFEPARVGGCVARQRVQQPFTFSLKH
jgi:hypothetical protein